MAEEPISTFLSIRLFSVHGSLSAENQQTLLEAMSEDLAKMISPYKGTLLSEKNSPIIFQFTPDSPETRSDLLHSIQGALYLLHRLAEFRLTRDSQEHRSWSLQFGIAASNNQTAETERSLEAAQVLASKLSEFAQNDQIVIDHSSFLALKGSPLKNWSLIESETDYAQTSQILYRNQSPNLSLPPELQKKSYHLTSPHIVVEDSLCFYYIALFSSPENLDPIPVLRAYSPKPLPLQVLQDKPTAAASEASDEVVLGRYTLQSVLGVGGMGQVWRARDTFGNAAALKMMLPGNASAEGQIERFRREAEIMSKLPHHNICRIFEVGEAQGVSYIAMELVEGLTLHELLHLPNNEQGSKTPITISSLLREIKEERVRLKNAGEKPKGLNRILPQEISLSIMCKMCDAIQFAHDHNILHRDLKPGNIMIREDGEPVVMDFGLGKLDNDEKGKDLSLTMEGAMLGTMQYMSPEQAMSSHTVDSRADVYSLGAILYEMLTGQHHFAVSGSLLQDAQKLQDYQPPSLSSYIKSIEKDLEMVVLKALHPEPDRRYRTPAALRADLERYIHGEAVTAKPVTILDVIRRMYRRNKPLTIVSIASIIAVLGAIIWSIYSIKEENLRTLAALEAKTISEQKEKEKTKEALEAKEVADRATHEAVEAKKLAEERKQEAVEALKIAEQRWEELTKAQAAQAKAEENYGNAKSDAELNTLLLSKRDKDYEQLEKEKERLAAEYKKKLNSKPNASNAPSDEQIQAILTTELPPVKLEISKSRGFDPMFNFRISRELTLITARTPNYIEPSLLLGKVYFSNGNFSEAFSYFIKIIEQMKSAKDASIQTPLANHFFSILQRHTTVDRDFFDETKGSIRMDHRSFTDSWKEISSEDASLATRFNDPSNKLNDQDRIAFLKFFSTLEKNAN